MHTEIRPSGGPQRAGIVERYGVNNFKIVLAIEFMENHLSDILSLPQISKLVGLSSRQLNRLFKVHLNNSTMDFYKNLRLSLSKRLLKQSSLSITEIAFTAGFSSSAQFSHSFKTKFGIVPSLYRNE